MSAAVDYATLLYDVKPEVAHADEQYRQMLDRLSALLIKDKLSEAEEKLADLLTVLVHEYEAKRFTSIPKASGVDVLLHLIEQHDLKQKDLVPAVFESEGVASDVINGKRDLTLKHMKRLSERFHLPLTAFAD